jgi:hypothetical protein
MREQLHIPHHEVLSDGKEAMHHVTHYLLHRPGVEDSSAESQQQDDKWKERQDGIRSDAEGIGMNLSSSHVTHQSLKLSPEPLIHDRGVNPLDRKFRSDFV